MLLVSPVGINKLMFCIFKKDLLCINTGNQAWINRYTWNKRFKRTRNLMAQCTRNRVASYSFDGKRVLKICGRCACFVFRRIGQRLYDDDDGKRTSPSSRASESNLEEIIKFSLEKHNVVEDDRRFEDLECVSRARSTESPYGCFYKP